MEDRGYTWFGEVLYRILKQRGASQTGARAWPRLPAELRLQLDARRTRSSSGAAHAGGGALRAEQPGVDRAGACIRLRPARQEEGSEGSPRSQNAVDTFLPRRGRAVLRGEDTGGLTS